MSIPPASTSEPAAEAEAPRSSRQSDAAPGFDMTYLPEERVFPPHWRARIPSLLYLSAAIVVGVIVILGENADPRSWLFRYVVTADTGRLMSMRTFAIVLAVGGVASVVRTSMRGVRVFSDGVETREVYNLVLPRVRRYQWVQMECIILDMKRTIALDLWDGSRAFLPPVANRPELTAVLERVGASRAIPVRGGRGLDDIPDPVEPSIAPRA